MLTLPWKPHPFDANVGVNEMVQVVPSLTGPSTTVPEWTSIFSDNQVALIVPPLTSGQEQFQRKAFIFPLWCHKVVVRVLLLGICLTCHWSPALASESLFPWPPSRAST